MAKVIKIGKFKINDKDYIEEVVTGLEVNKACELVLRLRELETDNRFSYVMELEK